MQCRGIGRTRLAFEHAEAVVLKFGRKFGSGHVAREDGKFHGGILPSIAHIEGNRVAPVLRSLTPPHSASRGGQTSFSLCIRTKSVTSNSSVFPWDVGSPPISAICSSFKISEYSGAVHAVRPLKAGTGSCVSIAG